MTCYTDDQIHLSPSPLCLLSSPCSALTVKAATSGTFPGDDARNPRSRVQTAKACAPSILPKAPNRDTKWVQARAGVLFRQMTARRHNHNCLCCFPPENILLFTFVVTSLMWLPLFPRLTGFTCFCPHLFFRIFRVLIAAISTNYF